MPKISVSDQHANLLVDFFREQEKELLNKLDGIRTVISQLLGDASKAVAPKGKKRGRKANIAKAALSLLEKDTPKKSGKRGRPAGAKAKVVKSSGSGAKRGRPAKKVVTPTGTEKQPA